MSLRKGSLKDYYNSVLGSKSAGCQAPTGGRPITCYQDKIKPKTINKLDLYITPPKN